MGSALVYVVVVGLVAAAVFLGSALLFGRGEELAPMPPGATPTRLPSHDLAGGDVRGLRFQQTVRGYKMSEVDWALGRLADEVDTLRARLERAEGTGSTGTPGTTAVAGPTVLDLDDPTPTSPTPSRPRETRHGHA